MEVYVLLTDNNVSYTTEFKGLWKCKPSPEQVCLMADENRDIDEWLGMGMFLLDNIGRKMNGFWIKKF